MLKIQNLDKNMIASSKSRMIHTLSFASFSLIYFWQNQSGLFQGVDGDYLRALNHNQNYFSNSPFYFTSNLFQGLGGNVFNPINVKIEPGLIVLNLFGNTSSLGQVLALTTWALLLFYTSQLLFERIGFERNFTFLASFMLAFCCLFPSNLNFTAVLNQFPWISTLIASFSLLTYFLLRGISNDNPFKNRLAISLLIFYILLLSPTWWIIFTPFIILYLAVTMLRRDISRENRQKKRVQTVIRSISLIFLLSALIPFLFYIAGFFIYSTAFLFGSEVETGVWPAKNMSMLFRSPLNSAVILAAIVGILLTKSGHLSISNYAIATVLFYSLLLSYGLLIFGGFIESIFPIPAYFEMSIYPALCIFSVFFAKVLLTTIHLDFITARQKN